MWHAGACCWSRVRRACLPPCHPLSYCAVWVQPGRCPWLCCGHGVSGGRFRPAARSKQHVCHRDRGRDAPLVCITPTQCSTVPCTPTQRSTVPCTPTQRSTVPWEFPRHLVRHDAPTANATCFRRRTALLGAGRPLHGSQLFQTSRSRPHQPPTSVADAGAPQRGQHSGRGVPAHAGRRPTRWCSCLLSLCLALPCDTGPSQPQPRPPAPLTRKQARRHRLHAAPDRAPRLLRRRAGR